MRLAAYAGTSTVLATGVILRAFNERANFYSACVYLSQSNACLMILTNFLLLNVCAILVGLQRLLYGPLRQIEVEQLYEKAWFAITETCLAMTTFRDEVGAWFLVMFVALLTGKVWGWIGEGRVEILEQQPPARPALFHARLSSSLLLSVAFDFYMLRYSAQSVLQMARPDMMVMFAFEFAVLSICSSSTLARYMISLAEYLRGERKRKQILNERRAELRVAREEALRLNPDAAAADLPNESEVEDMDIDVPEWQEKTNWVFALNLTTDFLKLIVYLAFFFILLKFYGLPIHIMRDVFLTIKSFLSRVTAFLRYRQATRDMNERYPDATKEEVEREDVCIVCRDDMVAWQDNTANAQRPGANQPPGRSARPVDQSSRPKKLPCGHVLHFGCLRNWLERQQSCPTCRQSVLNRSSEHAVRPAGQPAGDAALAGGPRLPQQQQNAPRYGHNNPAPAPAPQNRNGPRFFNLGPVRIGFGVGPANMLLNNNPINPPFNPPNPTTPTNHATPANSIQANIAQLEQQIMHEIHNLRLGEAQLQLVRLLQDELVRLRQLHLDNAAQRLPHLHEPLQEHQPTSQIPPIPQLPPRPQQVQHMVPQHGQMPMNAGDPNLPPGMTLPPGYTLLPLQRANPVANPTPSITVRDGPGAPPINLNPSWGASVPTPNIPPGLWPRPRSAENAPRPASVPNTGTTQISSGASPMPTAESLRARAEAQRARRRFEAQVPIEPNGAYNQPPAHAEPTVAATPPTIPSALQTGPPQNDTLSQPFHQPPQPATNVLPPNSLPSPPISVPDWSSNDARPSKPSEHPELTATSENSGPTTATSAGPSREAKGKAKAATVEDFAEDVD